MSLDLDYRMRGNFAEVVAVESDVQCADGNFKRGQFRACRLRDAAGKRHAAPANSDEREEFDVPPLRSTISWATRWSVRSISVADMSCDFSTTRIGGGF